MGLRKLRSTKSSDFSTFEKTSLEPPIQNIAETFSNPAYVRNPSWPAVTVNVGDNRAVGRYAVYPWDGASTDGNFFAVLCIGAYTVNYGDGSAPVNVASNTQVNYQYDYNNPALAGTDAPVTITAADSRINRTNHGHVNGDRIELYNLTGATGLSLGQLYYVVNRTADSFQVSLTPNGTPVTITTNGSATLLPYKIAIVTITPQAGQNITSFSIQRKHTRVGLTNGFTTNWLSLDIAFPNLTSFLASTNNPTNSLRHSILEEINIYETGTFTTYVTLFQNTMTNVKRIYFAPTVNASSVTVTTSMFWNCTSLIDLTLPTTLTNVVTATNMFVNCRSLIVAPLFNTSQVTNAASMYSGCSFLRYIPPHDFSACTTFASFANACTNLEYCSDLRTTSALTNVSSMFASCVSLKRAPAMNTSGVTDFSSMFSACYMIEEIPSYVTDAGTNFGSMFVNASSLKKIPRLNTVNGTNLASMFSGCSGLREIPSSIRTDAATSTLSMFLNCRMLERIHFLNAPVLTNSSTMFSGCSSLVFVEGFNTTSALTTLTSMFVSCASLKRVPLFDTSGATTVATMFNACTSLEEVPLFNTANVTNFSGMFTTCSSIRNIPFFNTASATTMANMFENCTLLERVPLFNTANVTSMSAMFNGCALLQEVPPFNTSSVTNISSMFASCVTLKEIPPLNFSAVTAANLGNAFLSCFSLQRMRATGIRFTFAIQNASLSAAALNEVYTNLPTVTGQIISVTGNYGIDGDNPAIATAKGWTVTS